jgi:ATP-dependent Clp protease protease subunit
MTWFRITHKNGVAHANIFGEIGIGAPAEDFIAELGNATDVELRLDCPGGDSPCGIKVHDTLRERATSATITGRCGSAGLIAVMGAQKISCISTARLLIHQPVNFVLGNVGQLRFAADGLEKIRTRFEQIISDRTKQPIETVHKWVAGETYFSAQEAQAAGLVDEIYTPPELPPAPAIVGSDAPGAATATEPEEMFRAWLRAFGKVPVADKDKFLRDVSFLLHESITSA